MKKTLQLMTAIAALTAVSACSESDDLSQAGLQSLQGQDNAVKFTTYLGRTGTSRAGAYGSINTARLADPEYGFGVFAYATGKKAYSGYRTGGYTPGRYPNFMYNEHIVGDGAGGWKYADVRNTKYWPNELEKAGAVDDQNNDSGNDPATSDYPNGGHVSFFAYAPYAATPANADPTTGITGQNVDNNDHDGQASGIIAFSGNKFNGGKSNDADVRARYQLSDPYLQYRIASDSQQQVDLLWGTTGVNGENVIGSEQKGMKSEDLSAYPTTSATKIVNDYTTTPATIVRPNYNVNTDLTKQKTNGTVDFAFKHALAKIGGSYVGPGDGSDEDGTTPTNGLLVILDIDKDGFEQGGSLQEYAGLPVVSGNNPAQNKYNTKVTINEVVLESGKELTEEGKEAIKKNKEFTYETMTTDLRNQGIFDLATGIWHNLEVAGTTTRTQTIVPSDVVTGEKDGTTADINADKDLDKDAVLNRNLAEPVEANWDNAHTKAAYEKLPIGVTTVAKNVYESEAQPFVFIPGTYPVITITIDYTVRTYDGKLADKYTEVRQRITKRLYILDEIRLNKQYNILMHLGLTSVKFSATVSDWEVTNATGTTTEPTDGTSPVSTFDGEELEHVYLPINVAGIASVSLGGSDFQVGADNTVTLADAEAGPDAIKVIDDKVIVFTRADGTKLSSANPNDIEFTVTIDDFTPDFDGEATKPTATFTDGKLTVTLPKNEGVSRSTTAHVKAVSSAGVTMATLDIVIPQKAATGMTTTSAALAYVYSPAYDYTGTFRAVDDLNMTYDINVTKVKPQFKAIMDDFARMLGALYRAGGVRELNYGGVDYTWDEAEPLKGSNWKSAAGTTLVTQLVRDFKSKGQAVGSQNLLLKTDRGNIKVVANVKSYPELAAEYTYPDNKPHIYKGKFVANVNNVTYTIDKSLVDADITRNVFYDWSRFLGALYYCAGDDGMKLTDLQYKGKQYSWNGSGTAAGSNYTATDGTTLYDVLSYEFRNGVADGTKLIFGTNGLGDIVITVSIK